MVSNKVARTMGTARRDNLVRTVAQLQAHSINRQVRNHTRAPTRHQHLRSHMVLRLMVRLHTIVDLHKGSMVKTPNTVVSRAMAVHHIARTLLHRTTTKATVINSTISTVHHRTNRHTGEVKGSNTEVKIHNMVARISSTVIRVSNTEAKTSNMAVHLKVDIHHTHQTTSIHHHLISKAATVSKVDRDSIRLRQTKEVAIQGSNTAAANSMEASNTSMAARVKVDMEASTLHNRAGSTLMWHD
jgi:hypothetical protein